MVKEHFLLGNKWAVTANSMPTVGIIIVNI